MYATYTPSERRENLQSVYQRRECMTTSRAYIFHVLIDSLPIIEQTSFVKTLWGKNTGILE